MTKQNKTKQNRKIRTYIYASRRNRTYDPSNCAITEIHVTAFLPVLLNSTWTEYTDRYSC